MPAYVPPALRNKQPSAASIDLSGSGNVTNAEENLPPVPPQRPNQGRRARDTDDSELYTLNEIHGHFWPSQGKNTQDPASVSAPTSQPLSDNQIQSDGGDQAKYQTEEEELASNEPGNDSHVQRQKQKATTMPSPIPHSTLNASEQDPEKLAYVVLFKGANPRWETGEGIIYAKTGLRLLTGSESSHSSTDVGNGDSGPETQSVGVGGDDEGQGRQNDAIGMTKASEVQEASFGADGRKGENAETVGEESESAYHPSATSASSFTNAPTETVSGAPNTDNPHNFMNSTALTPAEQEPQPSPYYASFPKHPIPIFAQSRREKSRSPRQRTFHFSGNYRITELDILAPRSPELTRMMDQKWNMADAQSRSAQRGWGKPKEKIRDPEKWKASLSKPWAVIKFEICYGVEGLITPKIERFDLNGENGEDDEGNTGKGGGNKKSVNELLQEMRFGSTA
ncbi:MAG: hypothetical protein Q9160_008292 [Pyrenula sp. 1 TL-2023]